MSQEGSCKVPRFDETNFTFYRYWMETHLSSLGHGVWKFVKDGYTVPTTLTNLTEIRAYENNEKEKNVILSGLSDSNLIKVMRCMSPKEVQDKLGGIYKGDIKVKQAKLHIYKGDFENLKMLEYEDIVGYVLQVDEVVNAIR